MICVKNRCNFYVSGVIKHRGGSRTATTSKVELFVLIVNGWKPLTIITKSSTLDIAGVLDPSLKQTLDQSNWYR